jgi:Family of unknown function (DUF6544)
MSNAQTNNGRLVIAEMLRDLPAPVQRYMRYTGVVGKPWVDTVRIKYAGRFRMAADKPWMPIRAEQFYTTNPPAFHWKARFKMAGLWLMTGDDTYKAGHGRMFGKVAGIFKVVDFRGDALDQGAMLRYLNEMTWFPTAFLGDNITWQAVDGGSAGVAFTDCGKSVSARMFFDDEGRMTNFVAQRYRENKGSFSLDTWSTPMTKFGVLGGLNLPVRGQAVWKLPGGDLPYADLELSEIEYNAPIEPF